MTTVQPFHSTMQAFGCAKANDSFTKVDGQLCLQKPTSFIKRALWCIPYFRNQPLSPHELSHEIVKLFSTALPKIVPGDVAGLAFCRRRLLSSLLCNDSLNQTIRKIEFLTYYSSPLFTTPDDVVPFFGSFLALRACSSTLWKKLPIQSLFERQKILQNAIQGDPLCVRKLAGYIALKYKFREGPYAKACFEAFYAKAAPDAKELFFRITSPDTLKRSVV